MPDITLFPEVPLYLKNCISFWQYLAHGQIDLVYPSYEKNSDGKVVLIPGEVFCRVADCKHERAKKGRLNKAEMTEIAQWFEKLMDNHENKKDGDENSHKSGKEGKVEHKDDSQEEEEEEEENEDEDEGDNSY
ncbi:hypothetical protein N7493_006035 [Penicillium malachiteum]|uniref:Uncharacterized protein n=1 Tax=Penicillium malachiteum TaxID=1324776 RepID=A0AAD6HLI6_9EURO|nr:hypothetical protein N7493_006035 [Penicillium malachiteum]